MDTLTRNHHPNHHLKRAVDELARIARPASVVLLAETVRAARELRGQRIADLKTRMTDGGYTVPSKHLAARVLATIRHA